MEQRIVLPPIESIMCGMPTLCLNLNAEPEESPESPASDTEILDDNTSSSKTPQYTLKDDLLILKTIKTYYGTAFHGRVPWCFWQTFRKATMSDRSSSSLYHHWNGAMKRKYGSFLNQGRLDDCIAWIQAGIASGKPLQRKVMECNTYTGMPLAHNWSLPPMSSNKMQAIFNDNPLEYGYQLHERRNSFNNQEA